MKIGIVGAERAMTLALERVVALMPGHQVIWRAVTGTDGVRLCAEDTPDLVLVDLMTPEPNAIQIVRCIAAETSCAVMLVAARIEDNASLALEAINGGAFDIVETPMLEVGDLRTAAAPLLNKIRNVENLLKRERAEASLRSSDCSRMARRPNLIAIGASAGGPAALRTILEFLPRDFSEAIVIVQHVDAQFLPGMIDWIRGFSALPIRLAKERDRPEPGQVLIAGTAHHLAFKTGDRLGYSSEPRLCAYRPSIDIFFESVARLWRGQATGVLLTGMGRDGAAGLRAMRTRGHHTIAQDQETSVVYGMPKAAAELDAAVDVLPLGAIAEALIAFRSRWS